MDQKTSAKRREPGEAGDDSILGEQARGQFASMLAWARYAESDFTLLELGAPAGGVPRYSITPSVVVRRLSNGAARTYAVEDGSAWLGPFKRDLDGGVYGKP